MEKKIVSIQVALSQSAPASLTGNRGCDTIWTRGNGTVLLLQACTGALLKALQKHRGVKARYLILEDSQPSGLKSRKGEVAKKGSGHSGHAISKIFSGPEPIGFPRAACCAGSGPGHRKIASPNFSEKVWSLAASSSPILEHRHRPCSCGIHERQGKGCGDG